MKTLVRVICISFVALFAVAVAEPADVQAAEPLQTFCTLAGGEWNSDTKVCTIKRTVELDITNWEIDINSDETLVIADGTTLDLNVQQFAGGLFHANFNNHGAMYIYGALRLSVGGLPSTTALVFSNLEDGTIFNYGVLNNIDASFENQGTIYNDCDAIVKGTIKGNDVLSICDGDDIPFDTDNCPFTNNQDQMDSDGDGSGDVCDNCPFTANQDQTDSDSDSLGNVCDNCPQTANINQYDGDGDSVGDRCDPALEVEHWCNAYSPDTSWSDTYSTCYVNSSMSVADILTLTIDKYHWVEILDRIGSGVVELNSAGTIVNNGYILIEDSNIFVNTSTIENYGKIYNKGTLSNSGTINNYCDASLTNTDTATFTGNNVQDVCYPGPLPIREMYLPFLIRL